VIGREHTQILRAEAISIPSLPWQGGTKNIETAVYINT